MILWIDSENGRRGGSVYLKRCHGQLQKNGQESKYLMIKSMSDRLRVIMASWLRGNEVRGTLPRELAVLFFCRKASGYIQSPIEEWSLLSRKVTGLLLRFSGMRCACVSRTTQQSAVKCGAKRVCIEYARIDGTSVEAGRNEWTTGSSEIVFVVMDNGLIDKGYLRHMSIIEEIGNEYEVRVEAYGMETGRVYKQIGKNRNNGFIRDPFEHARVNNREKYMFYLGCSRYEGLHMAVVEAAVAGIPSILSDIPAHRELEEIAGKPLAIGRGVNDNICMIRKLVKGGRYASEVEKCESLARRFSLLSGYD